MANNIPWVVVDLGNSHVKVKTNSCMFKFKSVFDEDLSKGTKGLKNTVEYQGKFYTIGGKGNYDREYNKVKKNYMPFLLLALKKATSSNDLNLCLLLPSSLSQYRDDYINKLQHVKLNYSVDGKKVSKYIKKCIVLNEGTVAYKALVTKKNSDKTLIIDIGSRTLNISELDENGVPISKLTESFGVYNYYTNIKEKLNLTEGESYTEEDIDDLVLSKNKIYTEIKDKDEMLKNFLYDVLNKVKANNIRLGLYDTYMIGGGAELLASLLKGTKIKIKENSQYLNVEGAFKLVGGIK